MSDPTEKALGITDAPPVLDEVEDDEEIVEEDDEELEDDEDEEDSEETAVAAQDKEEGDEDEDEDLSIADILPSVYSAVEILNGIIAPRRTAPGNFPSFNVVTDTTASIAISFYPGPDEEMHIVWDNSEWDGEALDPETVVADTIETCLDCTEAFIAVFTPPPCEPSNDPNRIPVGRFPGDTGQPLSWYFDKGSRTLVASLTGLPGEDIEEFSMDDLIMAENLTALASIASIVVRTIPFMDAVARAAE
jgi:hypothetical protein